MSAMEGRYYYGDERKTEAFASRCARWTFYTLWVVLIIYLLPNPNANWRMSSEVSEDKKNLLDQPQEIESISAQGILSHETDENNQFIGSQKDFLSIARSWELEKDLRIAKETRTKTGSTSGSTSKPKTYFAIFSGRQRYLEILFRYVTKFLDDGLIDEVHLWDFCRKTEDADYIAGVAKMDPRYVIKGNGKKLRKIVRYQLPLHAKERTEECLSGNLPPWVRVGYYCNIELLKLHILWKTMTHKMFPLFYKFYAHNMEDEDILVKCDDDVLFIDNLAPFVEYARKNPQISITYPSIVNNELAAFFQMRENMVPDPRLSQIYTERWPLWQELNEIFATIAYSNFYEEHSDQDYGPKLRTAWFQTYSAAWFLHDTFLKDRTRFQSEAVYLFEAPTRVSINMFAMRGDTCRKFFVQSDFLTDRLTDDEEALTWRMQKAFGTTNAFYLNTTCVHYSFSRQLLDLDQANKTFIQEYAKLAVELGTEPHYLPENTLYYGSGNSSEIGTNLIIGASVQMDALRALAALKNGGMSELGVAAKHNRLEKNFADKQPRQKRNMQMRGKKKPGMQRKPGMQQQKIGMEQGMHPGNIGMNQEQKAGPGPMMHKPPNGREMHPGPRNGTKMQKPGQKAGMQKQMRPQNDQGKQQRRPNSRLMQRPQINQGRKPGQRGPGRMRVGGPVLQNPNQQNWKAQEAPQIQQKPNPENQKVQVQSKVQQEPNPPSQKLQKPKMSNQPNQNQQNPDGQTQGQRIPLFNSEEADAATREFLASISAGPV